MSQAVQDGVRTDEETQQRILRVAMTFFLAHGFSRVTMDEIDVCVRRVLRLKEQLGLFDAPLRDRQRAVDAAADTVAARFGKESIRRGSALG